MKFNITPSHSISPLYKYSVFSEWKNPVMKKNSSRLFAIAKMFVLFQRLTIDKKKIYWGWKREEDRVEGKRVKKFMKKFLYLEFQIPSFFRITIASMWRRERRRKFNLLIATLECVSSKPKIESRKIRNIFLFYFVVSDLCACFGST